MFLYQPNSVGICACSLGLLFGPCNFPTGIHLKPSFRNPEALEGPGAGTDCCQRSAAHRRAGCCRLSLGFASCRRLVSGGGGGAAAAAGGGGGW